MIDLASAAGGLCLPLPGLHNMLELLLELAEFLQLRLIKFRCVSHMFLLCFFLGLEQFLEFKQFPILTIEQNAYFAFVAVVDEAFVLHLSHRIDYGIIILALMFHLVDDTGNEVGVAKKKKLN